MGFITFGDANDFPEDRVTMTSDEFDTYRTSGLYPDGPNRYQGFIDNDSGYLGIFDSETLANLSERYSYPQDLAARLAELNAQG